MRTPFKKIFAPGFSNSQPLVGRSHEPGLARRPLWSNDKSIRIANSIINQHNLDGDTEDFGTVCKITNSKAGDAEKVTKDDSTLQQVVDLHEGEGSLPMPAGEISKRKPGRVKAKLAGPCANTCITTALRHGITPYWHRPPAGSADFSPADVLCSKCYASECKAVSKVRKKLKLASDMAPD